MNFQRVPRIPFSWFLFLVLYIALSWFIFTSIYSTQPTPYIDEIFHVPQAIRYFNGTYEWDPKITTFPGLYIFSVALHKLLRLSVCTVFTLRLFNFVVSIMSFYLICNLVKRLHHFTKKESWLVAWSTFNIAIFPVSYFYSFLYYTDTLSTFVVLLMYRVHLRRRFWVASGIGFLAVLVRQTNIVWCGFLILHHVLSVLSNSTPLLRFKKVKELAKKHGLLGVVTIFKKKEIPLNPTLRNILGYTIVCAAFLFFVRYNGGIVLGDRSAHQPVPHVCQLFYFAAFVLMFSPSHAMSRVQDFGNFIVRRPIICSLFLIFSFLVVKNFTFVHIYLISDNRHFTFYFWKRVYEQIRFIRFALIPVYLFGIFLVQEHLKKYSWPAGYWIAIAIGLIPQELLEFRYFILPYLFFRIHLSCKSRSLLLIETIYFLLVNFGVLYIFQTKEFRWEDSDEIQRIAW